MKYNIQNLKTRMRRPVFGLMILLAVLLILPLHVAHAEAQTVDVGIPVEEHPELFLSRSMPTHGEAKLAVFLIDFPDMRNQNPDVNRELFEKIYFTGKVDEVTGWGNLAEFYNQQSYGKLTIGGRVFDWYTAKHERSYYDNRKEELLMEAAAYYEGLDIDFSQFDGDGDGVLDAVIFHFAGDYFSDRESPWYSGVNYGTNAPGGFGTMGGLKFITYIQIAAEYTGFSTNPYSGCYQLVSTACHELMHSLGMYDLYSTAQFALTPANDLMTSNSSIINPYTKMLLGWIDNVKVVTSDTDDIRLDLYRNPDQVVVVTDRYEGVFDEFYVAACLEQGVPPVYGDEKGASKPTIWYIDARLNESGTGFMNNNLAYNATPGRDTTHGTSVGGSPYLFVEELCSDPKYNYVMDGQGPLKESSASFGEGDVLGPNHQLSSDTHDGEYTGIYLDDFKVVHDRTVGGYVTFDVSFVVDTEAPTLEMEENTSLFSETLTLIFSEAVYEGDNWNGIQVLDKDGAPLDVTVSRMYYQKNRVEIRFNDEAYKQGYSVILPQGCLKDSSGNALAAATLAADGGNQLYAVESTQLPGTKGDSFRDNVRSFFFPTENGTAVITGCWGDIDGTRDSDVNIELMFLSTDGSVLSQVMVPNPCAKVNWYLENVYRTADGNYMFEYGSGSAAKDIFCLDAEGQLLWKHSFSRDANDSSYQVDPVCYTDEGLILDIRYGKMDTTNIYTLIRENGEVETITDGRVELFSRRITHYVDGLYIQVRYPQYNDTGRYLCFFDSQRLDLMQELHLPYDFDILSAHRNSNGTVMVMLKHSDEENTVDILLLGADLRLLRTVTCQKLHVDSVSSDVIWLDNDGLIDIEFLAQGNHSNNQYRVRRFDNRLNLLWESYQDANFLYFMKQPTGEFMAYRSMFSPVRECYIEKYPSEAQFLIPHTTHTMVFQEARKATCINAEHPSYWYCNICGICTYEDGTPTNTVLTLGMTDHVREPIPPSSGNCTTKAVSGGIKCAACDKIFLQPEELDFYGPHEYGEWETLKEPTCVVAGREQKKCLHCTETKERAIPSSGEHDYGEFEVTQEATCAHPGYQVRQCKNCRTIETQEIRATGKHTFGEWRDAAQPATCKENGVKTRACTLCGHTEQEVTSVIGPHQFGAWEMLQEPTVGAQGEERRVCVLCDFAETRAVAPLPPEETRESEPPKESESPKESEPPKDSKDPDDVPVPPSVDNMPLILVTVAAVLICIAVVITSILISRRNNK